MHAFGGEEAIDLAAVGLVVGAFGTQGRPGWRLHSDTDPAAPLPARLSENADVDQPHRRLLQCRIRLCGLRANDRIDVRSGLVFGTATLPGSIVGAIAVEHVGRRAPGRAPRQPATADRLVSRHLRVPRSARARRHLQRRLRLDLPRDRRGHHPRPLLVRALAFPTHMAPALAFRASDHGRLRSHTSLPAR